MGGDCISQTIPSALEHLKSSELITKKYIYDDSGDKENLRWLVRRVLQFTVLQHPEGRQGFGGAIRYMWKFLRGDTNPFIFHLEDDFTLTETCRPRGNVNHTKSSSASLSASSS